jgi:hypothetical protein
MRRNCAGLARVIGAGLARSGRLMRDGTLLAVVAIMAACQDPATPIAGVMPDGAALSTASGTPGQMPSGFTAASGPRGASLTPVVTETGKITVSADGLGGNPPVGTLDIEKPAGATVRSAYLMVASTGFSNYVPLSTDVTLNGANPTFTSTVATSISSVTAFGDVTAIVKGTIDGAAAGTVPISYEEVANTFSLDGAALVVIFDDPAQTTTNTVVLSFGAQTTTGDQFLVSFANPLDLTDPNLRLEMSLGISFGFQPSGQVSLIDVNGSRLTSCAGGQDDGVGANGGLITVGGTGDSPANPADPFETNCQVRSDDELYDLKPFAKQGDTQLLVNTFNPSNDDNIFLAIFNLTVRAAVNPTFVIDVEPEDPNNVVSLSRRHLYVAAVSSPSFDASTLDPTRCGVLGGADPIRPDLWTIVDYDGDGDMDLVLRFSTKRLVSEGILSMASTSLTVRCGSQQDSDDVTPIP